ncbi:unnamed protein product [Strongylus vulgaris]|uniref:RGS domain-containing protein n=1 Tax=Strongylus vulgaris TaxID=40348 RepID=A0A3P7L425_STRVU|nr:unnamed protein product [Strongylus vulgaris]
MASFFLKLTLIFKRVLRDPKLRQPFQLFLEQQFCAENLNFYVAVERFRDMQFNNESKASERANFARHIYERHFAANSTEPVNVDNSTSKRIRETMQAGKYPRNTFDLAQYQVSAQNVPFIVILDISVISNF